MVNNFPNITVHSVDRSDNLVATQLWFLKGSKDEPYKKNGMFHLIEHLLIASNPFAQDWFTKKYFTGIASTETVKFRIICEKENIITTFHQLFQNINNIPVSEEMISLQKRKIVNEIQYRKGVDFFQFLDAGLDIIFKNNTYSNCSGGDIPTVEAIGFDEIKKYWNILLCDTPFRLSMAGQLYGEELTEICVLCQKNQPQFLILNLDDLTNIKSFSFEKAYISSDSRAAMFFFQGPGKKERSYVYIKIIEALLNQCIDSCYMVRTSAVSYHAIGFVLIFVREENFKQVEQIKYQLIEILHNTTTLNMSVDLLCRELLLFQQDITYLAQCEMEKGLFGYSVLEMILKTPRNILLEELKKFALDLFFKQNVCLIQSDKTKNFTLKLWDI